MEQRPPIALPPVLESCEYVDDGSYANHEATRGIDGARGGNHYDSQTYRVPLLPYKHSVMCLQKEGTASIQSAVFNLSNTMIGAGIMSLPYAMNKLGLVPGVASLIFVSFLTHASIMSMLRCAEGASQISYSQIVVEALGKWGRFVLQLSIVINNFGLLTVFLIIVGDVFCGETGNPGLLEVWFGNQGDLFTRTRVLTCVVLFITPLACLETMDSLRISSQISVVLSLTFVLMTIGLALIKIEKNDAVMPPLFASDTTLLTTFSVINVINNAFICHFNIMPIYRELKNANLPRMQMVVRYSLLCSTTIYIGVGIFAVVLFGSDTNSDVLQNFNYQLDSVTSYWLPIACIIKCGYALSRILTFPLILFSLRITIDFWVSAFRGSGAKPRFFTLTALILLFSLLAAINLSNIWTVFQITGCTAAVVIGFVLPGLISLHTFGAITNVMEKIEAHSLVICGVIIGVIGIWVNFSALA